MIFPIILILDIASLNIYWIFGSLHFNNNCEVCLFIIRLLSKFEGHK